MKRLPTPKRKFTFTLGDTEGVLTVEDIPNLPESDRSRIEGIYQNWLESEKSYEREWRNHELSRTDFMMLPDATYKKELIRTSTYGIDIAEYRKQLREYDLKSDRPNKPDWLD